MKPIQPRSIEIAYYREINSTVDAWNEAVIRYAGLLPAGDERQDGYFEDAFNMFRRAVTNDWKTAADKVGYASQFADIALFNWRNWAGQVKAKTKFELPATQPWGEPGISAIADRWIDRNVNLIKGFKEQRDDQLRDLVFQAVRQGRSRRQLIADILPNVTALNETVAGATRLTAKQRADLIATDQILTANSQLNTQRMNNAQVKYYIWRGMDDLRERPAHVTLNDNIFRVDGQPMTDEDLRIVGRPGQLLRTPGKEIAPGIPVRCRCYGEAIFAGSIYAPQ